MTLKFKIVKSHIKLIQANRFDLYTSSLDSHRLINHVAINEQIGRGKS